MSDLTIKSTIKILHNNVDITSYVLRYERNQAICNGVGNFDFAVPKTFPTRIKPWDRIILYEDNYKIAEYNVSTVEFSANKGDVVINCQDDSKKLMDYFIPDDYTSEENDHAKEWIIQILEDAGVSYSFTASGNGSILNNDTSLGMQSAFDSITTLLQTSGWYMYFDSNSTCVIGDLMVEIENYVKNFTDNDILTIEKQNDDSYLRNRAVVWGATNSNGKAVFADVSTQTQWNYDEADERTVVLANSSIPSKSEARKLAKRMLDTFSTIIHKRGITVHGVYNVHIGDMIFVSSQHETGIGMVTSVQVSMSNQGLTTKFTLDEKCPRLFAYYHQGEPPGPTPGGGGYVYIATWGAGIWRKPLSGSTWESFSTGIEDLRIRDLFVANGIFTCVSFDGYAYMRDITESSWDKIEHGEFIDDNEVHYPETVVKAIACSYNKIFNVASVGYNTTEGDYRCWVAQIQDAKFRGTRPILYKSLVQINNKFYNFQIQDLEKGPKETVLSTSGPMAAAFSSGYRESQESSHPSNTSFVIGPQTSQTAVPMVSGVILPNVPHLKLIDAVDYSEHSTYGLSLRSNRVIKNSKVYTFGSYEVAPGVWANCIEYINMGLDVPETKFFTLPIIGQNWGRYNYLHLREDNKTFDILYLWQPDPMSTTDNITLYHWKAEFSSDDLDLLTTTVSCTQENEIQLTDLSPESETKEFEKQWTFNDGLIKFEPYFKHGSMLFVYYGRSWISDFSTPWFGGGSWPWQETEVKLYTVYYNAETKVYNKELQLEKSSLDKVGSFRGSQILSDCEHKIIPMVNYGGIVLTTSNSMQGETGQIGYKTISIHMSTGAVIIGGEDNYFSTKPKVMTTCNKWTDGPIDMFTDDYRSSPGVNGNFTTTNNARWLASSSVIDSAHVLLKMYVYYSNVNPGCGGWSNEERKDTGVIDLPGGNFISKVTHLYLLNKKCHVVWRGDQRYCEDISTTEEVDSGDQELQIFPVNGIKPLILNKQPNLYLVPLQNSISGISGPNGAIPESVVSLGTWCGSIIGSGIDPNTVFLDYAGYPFAVKQWGSYITGSGGTPLWDLWDSATLYPKTIISGLPTESRDDIFFREFYDFQKNIDMFNGNMYVYDYSKGWLYGANISTGNITITMESPSKDYGHKEIIFHDGIIDQYFTQPPWYFWGTYMPASVHRFKVEMFDDVYATLILLKSDSLISGYSVIDLEQTSARVEISQGYPTVVWTTPCFYSLGMPNNSTVPYPHTKIYNKAHKIDQVFPEAGKDERTCNFIEEEPLLNGSGVDGVKNQYVLWTSYNNLRASIISGYNPITLHTFSGITGRVETSNFQLSPYIFTSLNIEPAEFYQRNPYATTFSGYNDGIPSPNITCIRLDDRM